MSSFKTNKEWESTGISRMFSDENERLYPFMESVLFGNYFIVDGRETILIDDDDEPLDIRRRFFVAGAFDALNLINEGDKASIKHESITLLQGNNLTETEDYNCSIIDEIIHCNDKAGQTAYIFILKNGLRIVDSLLTQEEKELKKIDNVYSNKSFTEYGKKFLRGYR